MYVPRGKSKIGRLRQARLRGGRSEVDLELPTSAAGDRRLEGTLALGASVQSGLLDCADCPLLWNKVNIVDRKKKKCSKSLPRAFFL